MFVDAAQTRNEVFFKRADSAFGSVAAVHVGRHELVIDGLHGKELFGGYQALVVEAMQVGSEARSDKAGMQGPKIREDARAGSTAHRLDQNAIAVVLCRARGYSCFRRWK